MNSVSTHNTMSSDSEASRSASQQSITSEIVSDQPLISEDDKSNSDDDTFDMEAEFLSRKEVVVAKPPDGLDNLAMAGTNITEFIDQVKYSAFIYR